MHDNLKGNQELTCAPMESRSLGFVDTRAAQP